MLLQVMDDGRLTDGLGRTVDFHNALLVMTSNLGSPLMSEAAVQPGAGEAQKAWVQSALMDAVRQAFRPEFLNRLDERRLSLRLAPAARTWLAEQGGTRSTARDR